MKNQNQAFSLVEVVLALGVIAFAIVAILGLVPTGLQTGHSSQDETRAAQIAQTVFASMASEAQQHFQTVTLPATSPSPAPTLDLSSSNTGTAPAAILYADNNGQLILAQAGAAATPPPNATYGITVFTSNSPSGFDPKFANQVVVTVAWPASAAAANQTKRDFIRIISRY